MKDSSKKLFDKRYRYSIRRLAVGAASVAIGCLLFGTNVETISANTTVNGGEVTNSVESEEFDIILALTELYDFLPRLPEGESKATVVNLLKAVEVAMESDNATALEELKPRIQEIHTELKLAVAEGLFEETENSQPDATAGNQGTENAPSSTEGTSQEQPTSPTVNEETSTSEQPTEEKKQEELDIVGVLTELEELVLKLPEGEIREEIVGLITSAQTAIETDDKAGLEQLLPSIQSLYEELKAVAAEGFEHSEGEANPEGTPDKQSEASPASAELLIAREELNSRLTEIRSIGETDPIFSEAATLIARAQSVLGGEDIAAIRQADQELKRILERRNQHVSTTSTSLPLSHPTAHDQDISLSNEFIGRRMEIRNGKLRTVALENKLSKEQVEFLEGSKEFIIQFKPTGTAPTAPALPAYLAEATDRSQWQASTNSAANKGLEGPVDKTLDGELISRWHSNYSGGGANSIGTPNQLPAHVEFTFPTAKDIRTFIYVPRQDGADNGLVKDYKLYIKQGQASEYTEIKAGTITENPKDIQYIDLGELRTGVTAIKFEALSSTNNKPYAAAAEFDVSHRTVAEIKQVQTERRKEYLRQLDAYNSQFQISLDQLRVAENGIERKVDEEGETITFTFNPQVYNQVPLAIKYVINLKKDAAFSQSHLLLSVPEEDRSKLTIDTIDLQSYNLKEEQAYEEFSQQAPIAEMGGFRGFYAGLGQPVYVGSFYTGSEFPTAWNTVDENRKLFSRYYSGKDFAQLTDARGQFRTWNTVFGVARSNDYSVVQQDFYDYLAKIGQDTYFRKQYNSWFDHMKDITAENIQSSFNEIERGFTEGGVSPLHSYVVDDGWQTVASFWDFNHKFPNKLYDSSKQVKRFGSDFGLWLGPQGGYGNPHVMADHLVKTNQGSRHAGVVYIGDKRYTDGLSRLFENYDKEFDINYWKLDGLLLNPRPTTDEHGIGGGYLNMYSMTETHERWIQLYEDIREHATDPEKMWINLTSYIPPSPWFLQWVNSIWMQNAADVDYQDGVKKEEYKHLDFGSDAAEAITYRDDRYEELVKLRKWQLPFANIYNHDPVYGNTANSSKYLSPEDKAKRKQRPKISFTTDELRTYLYMLGTRGTGFWEFYYSSSMMDSEKWQVNGEAVKWIEANYDTLKHAVFHGGKPGHGEVYGYSAWDEDKGILSIRNPVNSQQTYTITLDRLVGMREGTAGLYRTTVLGDKRHDTSATTSYGDSITINLQPYETVIFQYSKVADQTPASLLTAKANASRTISLEFDEHLVLDEETSFTVSGHTVIDTRLNPDYRTVVLTLGEDLKDREVVTVAYGKLKDNAAIANISKASVEVQAYKDGIIQDISHVDKATSLENEGVEGRGVFSITAKVNLQTLNQVIAQQEGQWSLAVDAEGKIVFDVKGLQVVSAPFSTLKAGDKGQADRLITPNEDVTITAVRTANGSLKLYVDGRLHNSHFDATKVNQELSKSKLRVGDATFSGTIHRFILENIARDFETATLLNEAITPTTRIIPAPLDASLASATSFDPNDAGERPASAVTDGNISTYWVSLPTKDNRVEKQQLVIAMQSPQTVSEVRHTPRQASPKAVGNVKTAYLEHSLDGVNWQRVVIRNGNEDNTITFPETIATSPILFEAVHTKYFRLTALETHHWQDGTNGRSNSLNKIVAVAELTPVITFRPEQEESLTISYLRNLLDQVAGLNETDYSESSWASLLTVVEQAREALVATKQEEIDTARLALGRAISELDLISNIEVAKEGQEEGAQAGTQASTEPTEQSVPIISSSMEEVRPELPEVVQITEPVVEPGDLVDRVPELITSKGEGVKAASLQPLVFTKEEGTINLVQEDLQFEAVKVATLAQEKEVTQPSTKKEEHKPEAGKQASEQLPKTSTDSNIGLSLIGFVGLAGLAASTRRRKR